MGVAQGGIKMAYIRFTSACKEFEDAGSFRKEILKLSR